MLFVDGTAVQQQQQVRLIRSAGNKQRQAPRSYSIYCKVQARLSMGLNVLLHQQTKVKGAQPDPYICSCQSHARTVQNTRSVDTYHSVDGMHV